MISSLLGPAIISFGVQDISSHHNQPFSFSHPSLHCLFISHQHSLPLITHHPHQPSSNTSINSSIPLSSSQVQLYQYRVMLLENATRMIATTVFSAGISSSSFSSFSSFSSSSPLLCSRTHPLSHSSSPLPYPLTTSPSQDLD